MQNLVGWRAWSLLHIFEHSHCGISAVHGNHTSAGVSAGATQVNSGHRSAGGQAMPPHIPRQALALKDVPASEPDLLLNIWRTHHLRVQHGGGKVGTESADGIEGELAHTLTMVIPGAGGKSVRYVLGKHAHGVLPLGNHARVMHALE